MNPQVDPICSICSEEAQTVEHWLLSCPGTMRHRQELFGTTHVGLDVMTREPAKTITLARRTLSYSA